MTETQAIRELIAFIAARELRQLCMCGFPATQLSDKSWRPPYCDECVKKYGSQWDDWRDLPSADRFRALLGDKR